MNPISILNQLLTQLKGSAYISYIEDVHIFLGKRSKISNYPAIVINPQGSRLLSHKYPYEVRMLRVILAAGVKVFSEDLQIIGSGDLKGSYDMKKDIVKALYSDHTLDGKCIDLNVIEDIDDESEDYPVKGFILNIDIEYEQNRETQE